MRAVVQRVSSASVSVDGERVASIGPGLLVLLGVGGRRAQEADRIAAKLDALRVFEDAEGKMNLSVRDVGGELLVVSQLHACTATRARATAPASWTPPRRRRPTAVEQVRGGLAAKGGPLRGAEDVELVNDGPVTLLCRGVTREERAKPAVTSTGCRQSHQSAGKDARGAILRGR